MNFTFTIRIIYHKIFMLIRQNTYYSKKFCRALSPSLLILLFSWMGVVSSAFAANVPVGPQTNVAMSTVTSWGWRVVYQGTFADAPAISTVFAGVNPSDYVMYAAAPVGATSYSLLAAARASDVRTYTSVNTTISANGTLWYYNGYSIGFTPLGTTISQGSADVNDTSSIYKMSWHSNGTNGASSVPLNLAGGWRSGSSVGLNGATNWIRYVLVANRMDTVAATSVSSTGATLNGNLNPSGVATTGWFEWGTSPTLSGATSTTPVALGSGNSDVSSSAVLTGLTANTTYYFRFASNNGSSTSYGNILSFITGPEIAVEQPAGTNLVDGTGSVSYTDTVINNSSVAKTFTIRNVGNLDLTGLAITKDGTHAAEFTVGSLGSTTLTAGASTTFTVTFSPTSLGAKSAAIHIASNDSDEASFDINLTGTCVASLPVPAFSPASLSTSSATNYTWGTYFYVSQTCVVEQLGAFDAGRNGLSGSFPVALWNSSGTLLAQATVTNSATLVGDFRYVPLADRVVLTPGYYTIGAYISGSDPYIAYAGSLPTDSRIILQNSSYVNSSSLTYPNNYNGYAGYNMLANMLLSAIPNQQEILVEYPTGTSLVSGTSTASFPDALVNTAGSPRTFTIRNIGPNTLTGLAITKGGTDSADFTVSSLSSTSIASGGNLTFTVTFTPGALGARSASLSIASNDADENPFIINLSGNGVATLPTPGFTIINTGGVSTIQSYNMGWEFTAVTNCQVKALGAYDYQSNGLAGSMPVTLYDVNGTVLATTTLTSSDPLNGGFRYRDLNTPVNLTAGNRYMVAAYYSVTDYFIYSVTGTLDSRISYYGAAYAASTGAPTTRFAANPMHYFGANLLLQSAAPANSAPTALSLSPSTLNENVPANSNVGTLTTTDPNSGNTFTYTLVSGAGSTDNASFNISGSSLRITDSPDFETKNSYSVRVRTTDQGGLFFENSFAITITNVNEAPLISDIANATIDEDSSTGALAFTINDPDAGASLTLTATASTNPALIPLSNVIFGGSGGNRTVTATPVTNMNGSAKITVSLSDGSLTVTDTFTVTVSPVNDAPTDITLSGLGSLNENNAPNATVGSLSATDVDVSQTHTFSLVSGAGSADNGSFSIVGSSLVLNDVSNYEAKNTYQVRIEVNDGNLGLYSKAFTILINDVNEPPTALAVVGGSIAENNAVNATVATLIAVGDPDAGASHTFHLVSGAGSADNGSFSIVGNALRFDISSDFEAKNSYSVRIEINDGNLGLYSEAFTILINDVNEPPTALAVVGGSIAENNAVNATVATLTAVGDPDAGASHTFDLVSGAGDTDNASFSIDSNELKLAVVANFETKNSYSVRIRATDHMGGEFEKSLTISITNVIEGSSLGVNGNGHTVPHGDVSPEVADNTNFGSIPMNGQVVSKTFTLQNTGDVPLLLPATPRVSIVGTHATDFYVATSPTDSVAELTGSTIMQIVFKPTALGLRTATVSIPSNDPIVPAFTFDIQGTAAPYAGGTAGGSIAFSAEGYDVKQGATQAVVTLLRSGGTAATTVRVSTIDGSSLQNRRTFEPATLGVDYLFQEQTVSFALNEMSKTLTIPLVPRTGLQPNYALFLLLGDAGADTRISSSNYSVIRVIAWQRPTVAITTPAASPGVSTGLASFVATGTAVDMEWVGINRVTVSLNGGIASDATLGAATSRTRPWSLPIEPSVGDNTLTVTSYDNHGMASLPVTRTFTYGRRYRLELARSPLGSLSLATTRSTPVVALPATSLVSPFSIAAGSALTISAIPSAGQVFSHWSNLPPGTSAIASRFTYTMPAQDLAAPVRAAFVANPFLPTAGQGNSFYGLLRPATGIGVDISSIGYLTGTIVPSSGVFSGKLNYNAGSVSFTCVFHGTGSAIFTVGGVAVEQFTLPNGDQLSLNFAAGSIAAQITREGIARSEGTAARLMHSTTAPVADSLLNISTTVGGVLSSGYYTLALPAQAQSPALPISSYPQGDGYGTITLARTGTLTAVGVLADGSVWTASSGLVAGGQAPFFSVLLTPGSATGRSAVYGGSFSGTLAFDASATNSDVTADDLLWTRPSVTEVSGTRGSAPATQAYTAGWPTGILVDAVGALYDRSATLQTSLGLAPAGTGTSNASLEFTDGKLASPVIVSAINITGSTITKIPATNASFTLTATASTGAMVGTFAPNWTQPSAVRPTFRGILLQKGSSQGGYGYFQSNRTNDLDPESGRVTLGAP